VTNVARLDTSNIITCNGELRVQNSVINCHATNEPLVVFDVGANQGLWTTYLLDCCKARPDCNISVHAFEPVESTMTMLRHNLAADIKRGRVIPVCAGMSNEGGRSKISVFSAGCGTNALTPDPMGEAFHTEDVVLWTIDSYCEEHNVQTLNFVKIDAEGHDLFVIRGAKKMLCGKRIEVMQFEYNHRWIWSRAYLRDVFEISMATEYSVGKVTPLGVEFYDQWHPELEKYVEGNYLLCRSDSRQYFTQIGWWNS
jgi:FkbM family methyltransferase